MIRAILVLAALGATGCNLILGLDETHTATGDDDPAIDAEAEGGEEATVGAPDEPGTYDFHCRYHPDQMTGVLTVT